MYPATKDEAVLYCRGLLFRYSIALWELHSDAFLQHDARMSHNARTLVRMIERRRKGEHVNMRHMRQIATLLLLT